MTVPALIEERDVVYGSGSGRELMLDVWRPDAPTTPARPAVLWVHGGGWKEGERSPSPCDLLAAQGFVAATMSYRFSDEAIFPAQIHDVKAAIRFLRANAERWGIDPERIGIWGHSAGGHLAALEAVSAGLSELEGDGGTPAVSSAVQAAVPLSPPTDFLVDWIGQLEVPLHEGVDVVAVTQQLLGGDPLVDPEVAERGRLASPLQLAHSGTPPVLVVHGTLDDVVPVAQGRDFVEALIAEEVEASMLELPQDNHELGSVFSATVDDSTAAFDQIERFFRRVLGPVRPG